MFKRNPKLLHKEAKTEGARGKGKRGREGGKGAREGKARKGRRKGDAGR